jgi:hypothetical protein
VKEAGTSLTPLPSNQEFDAAAARVAELEVQFAELNQALGASKVTEQSMHDHALRQAQYVGLEQAMDDLRQLISGLLEAPPVGPGETDLLRPKHLAVLQFAQAKNLTDCPTCLKKVGSLDKLPTNENRAAFWAERVIKVEAKQKERDGVLAGFKEHTDHVATLKSQLTSMENEFKRCEELLKQFDAVVHTAATARTVDIGDLKADLDLARSQTMEMERIRAAWAPILRARDVAAEKEAEIDKWSRLIDALKTAIGNLLDKGSEAFTARVQKYLPEGDTFALQLRDDDREVCRYGILRNGVLHEALSGVEWAYVTAAIAAAAIPDAEKDKLHVIVFEDRSWDIDTLVAVCNATAKLEAQVIIATAPPAGWADDVPAGWTVVRLGGHIAPATKAVEEVEEALSGEVVEKEAAPTSDPSDDASDGVPKFIRTYITEHPEATHVDLMREFKISLNRALAFIGPKKKSRKPKEKKVEEPKPELAPYLE